MNIRRLGVGDDEVAREMFAMMVAVFNEGEGHDLLDARYVRVLLERRDFFAVAAIDDGAVIGGVTGHVLPMTRSHSSELFVNDLAVRADRQRLGVGCALVSTLRELAAAEGIATSFVSADNDDPEALAFYRAIGGEESPVTMFTFTGTT
jgi:aminoglycoside 3-N-acetyltransferase I